MERLLGYKKTLNERKSAPHPYHVKVFFSNDCGSHFVFKKVIRSSEVPSEQPHKIWMQSNQLFLSYGAHKLFKWPSWKMAAYGLVSKNNMGKIAQAHS